MIEKIIKMQKYDQSLANLSTVKKYIFFLIFELFVLVWPEWNTIIWEHYEWNSSLIWHLKQSFAPNTSMEFVRIE